MSAAAEPLPARGQMVDIGGRKLRMVCDGPDKGASTKPTVLFEALALDLSIVTTRWRGIPENLPTERVFLVDPRSPAQIAAQLSAARRLGPAAGAHRKHYLAHYTKSRHHTALLAALRSI